MADVPTNSEGVVATDGADERLQRVGSAKHDTASLNGIQTLPNHGNNRSGGHVFDQIREEALSLEVSIMLLEVFWGCMNELKRDKLKAALFKPADDLSDKRALHAIRFDHDEGTFVFADRHVGTLWGCSWR